MLSKKITKDELLAVTASHQIKNHDVCLLGVGMPFLAGALAKKIHAPEAVLIMESGISDFEPVALPISVADVTCTRGYNYAPDLFNVFTSICYAGYLDKAFLGVGQIDKYGNINTSFLGMPPESQRITGAGGAPEFYAYAKETILIMKGGQFVEKLPYVTSPGYLGGGDEREKSGRYRPGSGPSTLITAKGIFKFHETTKEIYLDSIFPGVSIEEIKSDIPWELKVAGTLQPIAIPIDEEIDFLRRFSPSSSLPNQTAMKLQMQYFLLKLTGKA